MIEINPIHLNKAKKFAAERLKGLKGSDIKSLLPHTAEEIEHAQIPNFTLEQLKEMRSRGALYVQVKGTRFNINSLIAEKELENDVSKTVKPSELSPISQGKKATPKEITPEAGTVTRSEKLTQAAERLIKEGKLTREYAEIFKQLDGLEGEEFATKAYELLAKSMGFKEYPKLRFAPLKKSVEAHCGGEGITLNSKIDWSKEELIGFMRHELEHYKQNIEIVKEFGINSFIRANKSAIMHQFIETPGYCYSRFGKCWDELPELDRYIAIMSELDKRFPGGVNNSELSLLNRMSGNPERIVDWDIGFASGARMELMTIEMKRDLAKMSIELGSFDSKAGQYMDEQACYLSPGNLPAPNDIALLEGGRLSLAEAKAKAAKVFESYNNCSLEREAFEEEGFIRQMWNAFISALK